MSASKIARRYSKALISLCNKDKSHDAVGGQLSEFVTGLNDAPEVRAALTNPAVDTGLRKQVLDRVLSDLKLSGTAANFLRLVGDNQRMDEIDGIYEDYQVRLDELASRVRASVVSATPLKPKAEGEIKAQLEKTTGKTVILETSVDPALLGGVVTRVGNLVLDGSVKTAIGTLREQLLGTVQ